ncbi:uncharacterized protein LOC143652216 isoform X1 [Tamandua tetradactyla]|uniref:uncharacterized protein LOC143652216 isoform X1 n=1 Tax=Tamandua tetradactyla TaxID=48850 RepID=UPI0040537BF4
MLRAVLPPGTWREVVRGLLSRTCRKQAPQSVLNSSWENFMKAAERNLAEETLALGVGPRRQHPSRVSDRVLTAGFGLLAHTWQGPTPCELADDSFPLLKASRVVLTSPGPPWRQRLLPKRGTGSAAVMISPSLGGFPSVPLLRGDQQLECPPPPG